MDNLITDKSRFKKELILFGLLAEFITYMMFYVFYMKEGLLYSGLTVQLIPLLLITLSLITLPLITLPLITLPLMTLPLITLSLIPLMQDWT